MELFLEMRCDSVDLSWPEKSDLGLKEKQIFYLLEFYGCLPVWVYAQVIDGTCWCMEELIRINLFHFISIYYN